jgi:hypothetical protein
VPGQVGVPGVRVDQVGAARGIGHRQVGGEHAKHAVAQPASGPVRDGVRPVRALAVHGDVDQPGELAGQVLDMHARPAIDLRRVLTGEQGRPHGASRSRRARGELPSRGALSAVSPSSPGSAAPFRSLKAGLPVPCQPR